MAEQHETGWYLDEYGEAVHRLTEQLKSVLAGNPPEVVAGALADCAALLIACHVAVGDHKATQRLRARLLAAHITLIKDLIDENAEDMGTDI